MNPLGQIPFITDGNFKLAESNAILVYLCEKYSQLNQFYGKNISERGKVNQHLSWHQSYFRPALFRIIFLKNYEGIKKNMPVYRQDL
jgi:glutathione S-transferase